MSTITVTNPIFDQVYRVQAWKDNNRTLKLVQGEGIVIPTGATSVSASHVKAPRFQLCDKRGTIDLSSGSPIIEWAVTRPQNSGEDLVACNIVSGQAANGIIEIPITTSVTEFNGDAYGEIRVTTSSAVTKFFGINACIGEGVSNNAVAQSSRFPALIEALQKVVSVQTGNVAAMDLLDDGDLPNGTNPVASGQLKTYLENAYISTLKNNFVDKTTTIAGHELSNNISAEDILSALMETGKSIYYYVGNINPFGGEKYVDVPVPAIWKFGNNLYLILSRTAGTPSQTYGVPYTYSGITLPRYTYLNSWDAFDPSATSGAYGEIVTGGTSNGVWICKGGTNWVQLAKLSDLSDIKAKTATVTLDSTLWLNGSQTIDVDSIYTLTSNTKVDIDVDSDTFVALQGAGCYGIYIETSTDSNVTTLIAKTIGATPNTDITIQLIFSETTDLGVIGGGDNE